MKRSLFALLLVVICLAVGCNANVGTGSLTVSVSLESSSKTAMPEKENIKVSSYKIVGTCGDSRFEKEFSSESCTITDLAAGTWSVSVEGCNNGVLVAKSSSQSIVIHAYQDVTAVFQLKPSFGGTGTFTFRLGIPKDATDMKQIRCSLIGASDGLGTYDFSFDFANGTVEGDYSIFEYTNQEISGGSYDLSVVTTNSLDEVFGIPINDSVVIYTDQTTSYEHIWDLEFFPEVECIVNGGHGAYTVLDSYCLFYIESSDEDAEFFYTVDGTSPNRSSKCYSKPFWVATGKDVGVMVSVDGWSRNGYQTFHVDKIGPAGGYVFYDCDADNEQGNSDGLTSKQTKWRYLEAAPGDLDSTYVFGYYRPEAANLIVGTSNAIGSGKANTDALCLKMNQDGDVAYSFSSGSGKAKYAAKMCKEYGEGTEFYGQWFLPSKDELNLMYANLYKKEVGSFANDNYWSSSEDDAGRAWDQNFNSGNQISLSRYYYDIRVRPVRAF